MRPETEESSSKSSGPSINPWIWISITAIVPLLLFLFMGYKFYQERTDFRRITSQFIQRQNTVMAYDAVEIATGFGDLLEKAGRDVQVMALLPATVDNYQKFYIAQLGDYTRYSGENTGIQEPLPFYNKLSYYSPSGQLILSIVNGQQAHEPKNFNECRMIDLCDRVLMDKAKTLEVGQLYYGRLLRYYSPEGTPEEEVGAGLSVAYRGPKGIYVLEIDYRHLRDHLTSPGFPYEPKKNLIEAYQKGNYIFIVDSNLDIITHPHYWKAEGIDRKTGEWVSPMIDDADNGQHPINIGAYQRGVLREYFQRLLNVSFKQKGVDIFQAPNLAGTSRILSVAPILTDKGQFKETGIFGHVIIACNVEYFEEPKEMIVPYY